MQKLPRETANAFGAPTISPLYLIAYLSLKASGRYRGCIIAISLTWHQSEKAQGLEALNDAPASHPSGRPPTHLSDPSPLMIRRRPQDSPSPSKAILQIPAVWVLQCIRGRASPQNRLVSNMPVNTCSKGGEWHKIPRRLPVGPPTAPSGLLSWKPMAEAIRRPAELRVLSLDSRGHLSIAPALIRVLTV